MPLLDETASPPLAPQLGESGESLTPPSPPSSMGAATPLLGIIIATAVLYFAKDVLMPLAMAGVLSVIFSPVASRLERLIGRFASSALVVATAVIAIAVLAYFLAIQLTAVAVNVTDHSENIAAKITALQGSTPDWLASIEYGVNNVERRLQQAKPVKKKTQTVVQAPAESSAAEQILKTDPPLTLQPRPNPARDRLVLFPALWTPGRSRPAGAPDRQNSSHPRRGGDSNRRQHGVSISIALLTGQSRIRRLDRDRDVAARVAEPGLLGSPRLSAAVYPVRRRIDLRGAANSGRIRPLSELVQVLRGICGVRYSRSGGEPVRRAVSDRTRNRPLALGAAGLRDVLGVAVGIAGASAGDASDLLPESCRRLYSRTEFLTVLLGADRKLEDYHDYYRKLLEIDRDGARALVVEYCDENGLEPTLSDVILPALAMMSQERIDDHISPENQKFIVDTTEGLVGELGSRFNRPLLIPPLRLVGVSAPGEVHTLGLKILLELLRQDGVAATFLGDGKSAAEVEEFAKRFFPNIISISCTCTECIPAMLELVRTIKSALPNQIILAGGDAANAHIAELLEAGCFEISATLEQARRTVRRYALQRARSRVGVPSRGLPGFTLKPAPAPDSRTTQPIAASVLQKPNE